MPVRGQVLVLEPEDQNRVVNGKKTEQPQIRTEHTGDQQRSQIQASHGMNLGSATSQIFYFEQINCHQA